MRSGAEKVERPGPVRVVFVDLDGPLPDLAATRPDGGHYVAALVFATRHGVPVGHVELALDGATVPADTLARALAALGDPRPEPAAAPDPAPFVSVVVPTLMRRAEQLERGVAALSAMRYPAFEVIVVDNRPDGHPDGLSECLAGYPGVSVVAERRPGISAARNRGLRHARGEIVAFTDDDALVDPGWLAAIGRRFAAEPRTDAVTGLVLPAELETPAQVWFEHSGGKLDQRYAVVHYRLAAKAGWSARRFAVTAEPAGDGLIPIYRAKFGMGVNMALRTARLRAAGGFDEALGTGTASRGGEDIAALTRLLYAGGGVTFDPAVVVRHYHRRTEQECRTQMYGYGVGYTAALTALVRSDPRHLVGLVHLAVPALGVIRRRSGDRGETGYPSHLRRAERRGLLAGPLAYLRSRRRNRSLPAVARPAAPADDAPGGRMDRQVASA
jgi:glycosyltransferase involved in cell wall biosynthesis